MRTTLERLEKKSEYEHSHDDIPLDRRILAITPDTGSFYHLLLRLIKAKRVLEIGTSVGYSTLWFADALGWTDDRADKSKVITIERNHNKTIQAEKNFAEAGIPKGCIEIREGIARDILAGLSSTPSYKGFFDFVFIDADKENAVEYFKLVIPLTKIGGLIGADNLYQPSDCVEPMSHYSRYIRTRTDVETSSVPIGNGQELTIKLS